MACVCEWTRVLELTLIVHFSLLLCISRSLLWWKDTGFKVRWSWVLILLPLADCLTSGKPFFNPVSVPSSVCEILTQIIFSANIFSLYCLSLFSCSRLLIPLYTCLKLICIPNILLLIFRISCPVLCPFHCSCIWWPNSCHVKETSVTFNLFILQTHINDCVCI